MPVCTVCAYPAEYLYTTYKTKSTIRLGVCARCGEFLDPLIEHPPLLLLLDLILLKPRIYLHLLFNRGSKAYDVDCTVSATQLEQERNQQLRGDFLSLALATLGAETAARLLVWNRATTLGASDVISMLGMVLLEMAVQHLVTTLLAMAALHWKGWYPKRETKKIGDHDGRQAYFAPIMISLTLFNTTLLPLILQLVLSIWHTPTSNHVDEAIVASGFPKFMIGLVSHDMAQTLDAFIQDVAKVWQRTDMIWAGTKLLGGMSAGFGLRVILPTRPWETTAIVLAGWGAASLVGRALPLP